MLRTGLLVCGVLSSLLYVAMTIFVAMQWEGYSSTSQTISELSAIGVWERINLGVFLLWVVVLAIALLRVEDTARGIVRGTANFSAHAHQRH
jgi:DNA-binding transcriptional regulator of glucitol operon